MKKLLFLLVLLHTASYPIYSQNFKTKDFHDFGNTGWETIAATATDADGNYYVCGSFTGTLQLGGQTVTSNGKRDIFLARINEAGGVWLKNYGGLYDDNAYSLLVENGTIYLAGSFKKEITLGAVFQAQQFTDVFVAKLSADGSLLKASTIQCESPAQPAYLQKGDNGNIIIAGSFKKSVNIGGTVLNATGKSDVYYAGFNENIDFENPRSFGGTGDEQLFGFLTDPFGDKYFVGSFEESFQVGSTLLDATGKTDGFLIKLNNTGQAILAKQYGGPYNDLVKCLTLDTEANIYLAGEFGHEITINNNTYNAPKKQDVFLVKLFADGSHEWERTLGGNSFNSISSLEMAQNGYFYISGGFRGELHGLQSARNSKDAFIRRYQADGLAGAPIKAGHNNEDNLLLKSFPSGELLATGYFSNAFGLGDLELTDKNYKDLFVGKLVDCESMPGIDLGDDQTSCGSLELSVEGTYTSYSWNGASPTTSNGFTINQTGEVKLTVTDEFGCTFSDGLNVTIADDLTIDLGPDQTFCNGGSIILTAGPSGRNYLWNDGSTESSREITETGTYSVTLNEQNCTASDEIVVTVNPTPVVDLGPDQSAPSNTDVYIDAGPGFASYLWPKNNTNQILCVPMHYITAPTDIWVVVANEYGCQGTDTVRLSQIGEPQSVAGFKEGENILAADTEGLDENILTTCIVYPNPTEGKFFISVSNPERVQQVQVIDIRGNIIKTFQNNFSFPLEINLEGMSKGVYLIKVSGIKTAEEFRVVIK